MVASVRMGAAEDDRAPTEERSCDKGCWFCSTGAAEDGSAPTEERSCIRGWWLLFEWGRPRTTALRQKSVRVIRDVGSVRRGRPRTAALRQKSVRVLGDGGFCSNGGGRGRPRSDRRAFV